jgi:hypothetical protein
MRAEYTVWIESMTKAAGLALAAVATIFSILVSETKRDYQAGNRDVQGVILPGGRFLAARIDDRLILSDSISHLSNQGRLADTRLA